MLNFIGYFFLIAQLLGCVPVIHPTGEIVSDGQILKHQFIAADGAVLPLRTWLPEQQEIKAIVVALHGFNDYSHFFQLPGEFLKQQGIASFAYDQRGFGGSALRGLWAGTKSYTGDLKLFVSLIHDKYPGIPVYLLGESMGGAIVIEAMSEQSVPAVSGLILSAPAVWARKTMPWYQRLVLWSLAHTVPWMTFTGESVGITPSDNLEMLRALGKDPLVIKETRVETINGLVDLMDAALESAERIQISTLMLYGEKDEVIPLEPTYQFINDFIKENREHKTIAFYKEGYHMLLRDLQAGVVWNDIVVWLALGQSSLPSGADIRAGELLDSVQY